LQNLAHLKLKLINKWEQNEWVDKLNGKNHVEYVYNQHKWIKRNKQLIDH
jgi:hypothetical protein